MTIQFDPLLPPYILLSFAFALLFVIFVFYKRYKAVISSSFWKFLIGLKFLSLLALFLLLLNPSLVLKTPDTAQANVVFLIDDTGSMQTKDAEGKARIQFAKDSILNPSSKFHKKILEKYANSHTFLFAGEEMRRIHPGFNFSVLPGETDIDYILGDVLDNPVDQSPLGAVVLVSDGLDNRGLPLMEAAKKYRKAGVPIHCVGVGDPRPKPDLGINWKDIHNEIPKNQLLNLTALITNKDTGGNPVVLSLFENGRLIETREVTLDDSSSQEEIHFEHTPFTPGFKTYKIEISAINNEHNTLNNKDFVGVDVTEPEIFNVLFFSANLDWDYKFLNRFSDHEDRMNLDAVIRLGKQSYFTKGIEEKQKKIEGFPGCSALHKYDCIIMSLNALYLLDEDDVSCLINFVENRGGGVIFTGQGDEIPEAIKNILPIKSLPTETVKTDKNNLVFRPSKVLSSEKSGELGDLTSRLYVPANSEMIRLDESAIKPGANVVASSEGLKLIALAVQYYGSGKVALLNLPNTWKWAMQDDDDGGYYFGLFWGRLISWLSSSSKDRLTIQPASTKLLLTDTHEFLVDVLDSNYLPDNSAEVNCTIIGPAGGEHKMEMIADSKVDGRYKGKFIPRNSGDYRFYFKAMPSKGGSLEAINDYIVIDLSPESEPHPMAEGRLQSLARQTGGTYWNYEDVDSIKDLKLSEKLTYKQEKRNFKDYWWYFAIILMAVLPDWIFRRRVGLK